MAEGTAADERDVKREGEQCVASRDAIPSGSEGMYLPNAPPNTGRGCEVSGVTRDLSRGCVRPCNGCG